MKMNAWLTCSAYAAMMTPSTNWWGSRSTRKWSLKVAGSDSSPFTTRYDTGDLRSIDHLRPAGKPAPPRPSSDACVDFGGDGLGEHRERLAQCRRTRRSRGSARACTSRRTRASTRRCGGASSAAITSPPRRVRASRAAMAALRWSRSPREGAQSAAATHADQRAVGGHVVVEFAVAQFVDQRVEGRRGSSCARSGGSPARTARCRSPRGTRSLPG